MVVTPHEFTLQTAVRPRIVMLWVFFLVTVVVVGPSVPASAFVSCTWHHSHLPGEQPGTVNDDTHPIPAIDAKVPEARSPQGLWHHVATRSGLSIASLDASPVGITPTGIAPRAPPATR
jgi:hypothetical protein